jgi:hypothetical protein
MMCERDDVMKHMPLTLVMIGILCSLFCIYQVNIAHSGEMTDEMKKMQEHLNNQVLSQPFSVADEAQVKAYIEDAPYTGKHWRPGYTCYDLRPYSYREYLGCRHYYFYYGRYYP